MVTRMTDYKTFTKEFFITENFIDLFGHVSNDKYMQLYDLARWEIITELGYGYEWIKKHNICAVIIQANINFKKEIKLRDTITVYSKLETIEKNLIMRWKQVMIGQDKKVHSDVLYKTAFFDMVRRRIIPVDKEFIELNKIKSEATVNANL